MVFEEHNCQALLLPSRCEHLQRKVGGGGGGGECGELPYS